MNKWFEIYQEISVLFKGGTNVRVERFSNDRHRQLENILAE